MPTMRQSRRSLMMMNRNASSGRRPAAQAQGRPLTKREQFTTAQSIRSFLETGSVITPSEDGHNEDSFSTLDVCLQVDEDDSEDDSEQATDRTKETTLPVKPSPPKIGALESKSVRLWRVVVICSILVIGLIVSSLTYVTLRHEIIADANDAFQLFVDTMASAFQTQMQQVVAAHRALSHAITTAAVTADASDDFPYFIVPSFEVYAHEARQLSRSDVIMYAPLVRDDAPTWSRFATQTSAQWLSDSKHVYDALEPGLNRSAEPPPLSVPNTIWSMSDDGRLWPWKDSGLFVPSLHTSPPPMSDLSVHQNINLFSNAQYQATGWAAMARNDVALTRFQSVNRQFSDAIYGGSSGSNTDTDSNHNVHPHSVAAYPVYRRLESTNDTVGFLYSIVAWKKYLAELLPARAGAIDVVLQNTCGQMVTYVLQQEKAVYKGDGDLHDTAYTELGRTITFSHESSRDDVPNTNSSGHCQVMLQVYPTAAFQAEYNSIIPNILSATIGVLFGIMAIVFAIYDRVQTYLNTAVVDSATRSNAIVSSLFPSNVRDRLLAQATVPVPAKPQNRHASMRHLPTHRSTKDDDSSDDDMIQQNKPIADLFPATTVLFADVVGFTAWSSTREASQVFTLLETVYQAFDEIAGKRGIFKVETIGDCYVAVCGLPDPTVDHAVNMARFARKCLIKMQILVKKLESTLGPDTSDLTLRIGMHSGPVTAGVLRGERSRFQLFGDTVNTASRMESTGKPNRIQLSQETANLLEAAGKAAWLRKREDKVHAKGKGLLQTYYLELRAVGDADASRGDLAYGKFLMEQHSQDDLVYDGDVSNQEVLAKNARLVAWNTTVLLKLLKEIAAKRGVTVPEATPPSERLLKQRGGQTVLDEVKEIIALPGVDSTEESRVTGSKRLDPRVAKQLHLYLTTISSMYQNNPFHNFDHATHVAMSVVKLLSRIVAPSLIDLKYKTESALIGGDHTYGITSDPLTQFSCVLSALIHDVDHSGVPNATLVKEHAKLADKYQGKSIAEQNSVDLAWSVLMEDQYSVLRKAIYSNETELTRFRQLIVNSVMATDIVDPQQKEFRNARWDRAFCSHDQSVMDESEHVAINRKATIVIEHLIQASDVAHTMQHWHIYRKWNERFFRECYQAYQDGRAEVDPSINWYKGEIGFFDFYIIPLAKKLKDCGVFGVSSDEYLNYAIQNRQEWESRGQEIVAKMIEKGNATMVLI